jgi:hypothetical protein
MDTIKVERSEVLNALEALVWRHDLDLEREY